MVEIYYLTTKGEKWSHKCPVAKLELFLQKFEYKGLQVVDWVYL